ncbi:MAG: sensor histidine kinase, partial [Gemmataceae bacterium]
TLLDGAVEDASNRGRFLEQILGQSDRLHALILDLLSLARIESGAELMQFQSIDIGALVRQMVERHRARAEARRQELLIHEAEPGLSAWADEEALEQILDNLTDNALKYTPEGGRVELRWRSSGSHLILEVSDTGIGISEADLPRIFERFYRVDRARSRELGGTGLGLAIVKHLAQAMKGSIRATSKMGEGTTFQVRLPMAPNSNRLGDAPSPRMVSS